MKTKLLVIGTLVVMSMTSQLYAQKTTKKEKERKVKVEKTEKAKTMEKVEMPQMKASPTATKKAVPMKESVQHGHIDPITGEQVITPATEAIYVTITSPESNLSEGEALNGKITVKGRTNKNQTVEIRVQSGKRTVDNYTDPDRYYSKLIEDWRSVKANADGDWKTVINVKPLTYSAGADWDNVEQHFFTILVRSKNDKSKIEVVHFTRLDPKN